MQTTAQVNIESYSYSWHSSQISDQYHGMYPIMGMSFYMNHTHTLSHSSHTSILHYGMQPIMGMSFCMNYSHTHRHSSETSIQHYGMHPFMEVSFCTWYVKVHSVMKKCNRTNIYLTLIACTLKQQIH